MENKDEHEVFNYTYSAKDQDEIRRIRRKYAPAEEDKMTQLRRMDAAVYKKAMVLSLSMGIAGALILGVGMCCAMVWQGTLFIPGIVIGILGIAVVSLTYPLYNRTLKKEREKIASEILRLTDDLMK
ncbi:MAG: hypothetical protein PUD44_09105 [Clostridiaceae bacterium]|nr:hypothetical protein [Clostridiaceae bacterium]MDY3071939.1 hypothetical protein [Eubacteriales bacterium]